MSFRDFKVLTFDVVGTLIDFESGILRAVRRISGKTPAELSDDRIFESYKRGRDAHYERSSEVMGLVYLHLAKELGIPADSSAAEAFQMEAVRIGHRDQPEACAQPRSAFSFYSHTLGNRRSPTRSKLNRRPASRSG
jgi:putative hydrolase of the HAD superfamily